MEKKCIYCENQLDLKLHGLTKYCSTRCRNKDYYLKKKNDMENGKLQELQSGEELSKSNNNSLDQQPNISSHWIGNSTSQWSEETSPKESQKEKIFFPESYKAILEEKSKNFELQSKIHILELRNEALLIENHELEVEIGSLTAEIESFENDEKAGNASILGIPSSMFENVLVQVLAPHAGKIISGLTSKTESTDQ